MSYSELLTSLISEGKANVQSIWTLIKSNFQDHQSRLNTLESLSVVIPTGCVIAYGSNTVPPGFLACDGSEISRAEYSALFLAIGETYGAGDSANTFNLPDFRGRAPLGAGQGTTLTNRVLGTSLGSETHALQTSEIPSHTHSVTDPGHFHNWPAMGSGLGNGQTQSLASSADEQTAYSSTGLSLVNAGSGTAHNNMQPFNVAAYIIKY